MGFRSSSQTPSAVLRSYSNRTLGSFRPSLLTGRLTSDGLLEKFTRTFCAQFIGPPRLPGPVVSLLRIVQYSLLVPGRPYSLQSVYSFTVGVPVTVGGLSCTGPAITTVSALRQLWSLSRRIWRILDIRPMVGKDYAGCCLSFGCELLQNQFSPAKMGIPAYDSASSGNTRRRSPHCP